VALFIHPALAAEIRNVVSAKAASPSGAGSAIAATVVTDRSSLTVK
jgi:hypothetical protein